MKKSGKMLSVITTALLMITTSQTASLADNVNTVGTSEEGLVTYSEDFESYIADSSWTSGAQGLGFYNGGSDNNNKMKLIENNSIYPELKCLTESFSPYMIFKLKDAEYKTNLIADADKYTVEFDLMLFPESAKKNLYLYLGSAYGLYVNASKTTYSISALSASGTDKVPAEDGAVLTYQAGDARFFNYKIVVDKENAVTSLRINDNLIFKDVPQRGTNLFEELKINPYKMIGKCGIDNLKVTVTDTSVCHKANWAEDSIVDFEDFTVGNISQIENAFTGGFDNSYTGDNNFHSVINYSHDSQDITAVNKYLTVTKTATDNGTRSIKRDITNVISDSSVYDLSFKVKNELTLNTAFIKVGNVSAEDSCAMLEFGADGTVNYFDYSKETPKTNIQSVTMTNGEWIPVKFRIYKNENKADLYFSDMDTPVATGFSMNRHDNDETFDASNQNSATGNVSIDDIKVTSVEQDDYVLTYYAGSTDMNKYISGSIVAECATAQGKELPVTIIAEYDADGTLVNTAISSLTDGSENIVRAELENPSVAEGQTVKILLWNSLNVQKPIKRSVTLTPAVKAE